MSHSPVLLTSAVTAAGVTAIPTTAARVAAQAAGASDRRAHQLLEQILDHHPPRRPERPATCACYFATPGQLGAAYLLHQPPPPRLRGPRLPAISGKPDSARRAASKAPDRIVLRAHRQKRKAMSRPA